MQTIITRISFDSCADIATHFGHTKAIGWMSCFEKYDNILARKLKNIHIWLITTI